MRVMVVEDDPSIRETLGMVLEAYGHQADLIDKGEIVLDYLKENWPDVILLDILMPGIDGLKTCEMLNADPLGNVTPIIILSALDKNQDKLKAYKLGVVDYLTKPIEKNTLITKIEKALRSKQK